MLMGLLEEMLLFSYSHVSNFLPNGKDECRNLWVKKKRSNKEVGWDWLRYILVKVVEQYCAYFFALWMCGVFFFFSFFPVEPKDEYVSALVS